jgi:hypothetical protein
VTTGRLTALPNGIGVEISKRQVARLLTSGLDGLKQISEKGLEKRRAPCLKHL